MLGAIRICGRWIDEKILERLSQRSQGPTPPSQSKLVEDFCRQADWRDAKGRLSTSSARVGLLKLEKRGLVQLPAMTPRCKSAKPRGLVDDQELLPPLPTVPTDGHKLVGLKLRLIANDEDPQHWLWNRLIVREHPLGSSPLVGAQLRYLVEYDGGTVGALGFGPPAYHLACRDEWIGWPALGQMQNRNRVIGLSRFLIRHGLRVPNLASQCYSLVLGQVGQDWFERYGVQPLLVETYVDRSRFNGRSLAAANWRRLGQSKGRGRDDRLRQSAKSIKDVWVYELDPKARTLLQATREEVLIARSVFAPAIKVDWAQEEMAGVDLGDQRLNDRAARILLDRWNNPLQSFYRSFGSSAAAKGAYKLVESPRCEINLSSLLAPHYEQTARRMAAEKVVLLAQDTSALSYNSLKQTTELGPIGQEYTRGLLLHSVQAFRMDGIPLGTAWSEVWARPQKSKPSPCDPKSCDQKESARWIRAFQEGCRQGRQMPKTQILICGDRESDLYEIYDQKKAAPKNVHLLVRGQHDRYLTDQTRLMETLEQVPVAGTMRAEVPRREGRPARTATLELRWKEVELKPPTTGLKQNWPPIKVHVVLAREVGAPEGVEAIEWLLITTWPVTSLKMAARIVRWYALRWGIECWHKVLKVVCGVERRQMKSAQTLERALAFDMIVASRVLLLTRLGKENPELPADLFYTPDELKVLDLKKKRRPNSPRVKS
jgi:hypothetical protein